jgi:hypothetical protein
VFVVQTLVEQRCEYTLPSQFKSQLNYILTGGVVLTAPTGKRRTSRTAGLSYVYLILSQLALPTLPF